MISLGQATSSQVKPLVASTTKFSNYVSGSNNLTPASSTYAAFQKSKNGKTLLEKHKPYNSISSFNLGAPNSNHNNPTSNNTVAFQSGHQSMISAGSLQNIIENNNNTAQKRNA